jgi:hypothetical protein
MTPPGQPDWDERVLLLGKPKLMDTPTLIEWIQRQLETPAQTLIRFLVMRREHREWHKSQPGIYTCCINLGHTHPEYDRILRRYNDLDMGDVESWNSYVGRVWQIPTSK